MTAALRPPIELVGARAREHRTAHFRGAKTAAPARAHRPERPSNRRAYANAAVSDTFPLPLSALPVLVRTFARVVLPLPTLVAGRTYVELLRDRTHLETSGPSSSARPPPPRRNRQGRRSRPTIGYDRGGSPAPTRGAALAGLVRLPTQQAPLRYGNPCSARGARCHCARPLTFGTGSSTRLLPRSRLDTRATCRAATTLLLHLRRPAARAAHLRPMQWRHSPHLRRPLPRLAYRITPA